MKKFILFPILLAISSSTFSQSGADLLVKNEGFFKIGFSSMHSKGVYDNDGEKKIIPETWHRELSLYSEYGLSDKWNVNIYFPFVINKVDGEVTGSGGVITKVNEKVSTPGDPELGIKYQFISMENWKMDLGISQSFGISINDQENGINTGYSDFSQKFLVEMQFKNSDFWYIRVMAALNNHNLGYGDEAHGDIEIAGQPLKNLWIIAKLSGIRSAENGDLEKHPVETGKPISEGKFYGLYAQHASEYLFIPEIKYKVNSSIGAFVSYSSFIKGKNTFAAPKFFVGVFYSLNGNEGSNSGN